MMRIGKPKHGMIQVRKRETNFEVVDYTNPCKQRWLYQGILLTERFPKFGYLGNSQKYLFVMLMPSHSWPH